MRGRGEKNEEEKTMDTKTKERRYIQTQMAEGVTSRRGIGGK